jgi:hypothetical protein
MSSSRMPRHRAARSCGFVVKAPDSKSVRAVVNAEAVSLLISRLDRGRSIGLALRPTLARKAPTDMR